MLFLKKVKKSFLALTMMAIVLAGSAGLSAALFQAEGSAAEAEKTTEGPIFSFMSISDIHDNTTNLSKALDDSVANNVSAIAVVGDLTNFERDDEYDAVMNMMNSKPHAPVYYTMGNHEYDYENDFNISKNRFLTKTGAPSLNYDKWIKGYHFIFLSPELKPAGFTDETISWLDNTLAEDADPNKPIFLFLHQPLDSTASFTFPSNNYWGLNSQQMYKIKDILANYPQSVFVTGHIHDDIKSEGNLYSEKFSAVRDGAVVNNQGLIFDVYSDKVQMRGRDLNSKTTIWNGTTQLIPDTTGVYEAEDGSFSYATNADDVNGSGGKVVNMKDGRAYLEMLRIDGGASGGQKILKISYAAAAANASMGVYVNGTKVQTLSIPTTGGTGSYSDLDVAIELKPGPYNKIAVKRDNNATEVNLDKLQIIEPANYSTMWGFNGNGNDSIPNGFNATLHGSAAFDTTNKMEGSASLSLDGADGNYASADLVSTKTDDVTLTEWVKWNGATSGSQQILSNGDGLTNGYAIVLDHSQGDKVSIAINGQTVLGSQTALTAGQWTNITAARRSGTWELYVNGNSVLVTNNTTAPAAPTTGTYIGADNSGKNVFNGHIDAVRVYNHALSIDQIKAIANETSDAKLESITITNLPTKRSYAIDEKFDVSGMTVVGTYSDGSTRNETINGNNITGFNPSAVETGQTLTVTVGGKTATFTVDIYTLRVGAVSVPGVINAVNYIAKHDFIYMGALETGILPKDTWLDYSVNVKSTGTYRANYMTGRYDGGSIGVDFIVDGVLQNTTPLPSTGGWGNFVTTSTTVALTEGPHTIRLRVAERVVIRSLELIEQPDQKLNSITAPAPVTAAIGSAKTAATLGLPEKVALVTDLGNVDASVTWDVNAASYDPTLTTEQTFTVTGEVTLPIGVINPNNVPLTTSINVTVKPAELVAHWKFDEGSGTTAGDSSGNGNTGTLVNNPTWTDSGKIGGALAFSGGSRAEFNASATLNQTGNESVSLWFKTSQPKTLTSIFRHSNRFTALQVAGEQARVAYWPNASSSYKALYFPWTYNDNNWHHYVAAYDRAHGLKIYVDGNVVASDATNLGPLPTVTNKIVLGANESGGEAYNGLLADVRVFNGALTQAEVTLLMKAGQGLTLKSITASAALTGVVNGTAKTSAALGLPATVELVTDNGNVNANVVWDVEAASYDPAEKSEQTFTVNGTVTLPEGVDNPKNVALTASIQVTVLQASTMPQSTLTGAHQAAPGQTFDLTMGLSGVTESVYQQMYAQDLTLHYDPANVKFDSVTSLRDEFEVIDHKEIVPGQIRIVAASVGGKQGVSAQGDLLKFKFTVKSDTQATDTTVSVGDVAVANGEGNELPLNGASHALQISMTIDKSGLNAAIASAEAKHDAAVEGNEHGMYAKGSKAQLQSAIDAAKATASDPNATQQQVDSAKSTLEAAIQVFESKKISADVNGKDGITVGDLAIVAAAYGKQEGQPGWNAKADVNHDGKVDIEDLAIVAKAILQ
ncbi:LamG-like jellyroll fold domain-containing protein [Paenibacillus terrigena]|uniref:LamG-like jellyroll fold domain-containing protein n=1 Tax=Paenibacillus terrigena TaxID=369333 RepID=UPI0028D228FF|nr:LamG-like jellyroll fold domain-containing protein [Paenibacillus terrigena]